jgi:uncharacterized protein YciI
MLATNGKFVTTLVAAAIAAAVSGSVLAQAPQTPAAPAAQVVRPADLMTAQERENFRKQMEQATTAEERQKVRDAHRAAIEQRAKDQGVTLAGPRGPGHGPGAGGPGHGRGDGRGPGAGPRADGPYSQLFSAEERDRFRDQMRSAQTVEERQKLRDEHRALAEARAKEKGITLPHPGSGPRAGGSGMGSGQRGAYAQLFTAEEREQFRAQMHGAQTAEERMKLRDERHALAQARAKDKGIEIPAQPRGPRGPGHGHGHRWQQTPQS